MERSLADCKKLTSLIFFENLILVQGERWWRALGMQVERVSRKIDQRQTGE